MAVTKTRSAAVEAFERELIKAGAPLVEKWAKYLDAPGAPAITDATERYVMATMLETESKVLAKGTAMEAVQTTSVFGANYLPQLLGMIRQIQPRLFGTQLVATQPLDRPTGQIFHLAITRDDGSTYGAEPSADVSARDADALIAARSYADFGDQTTAGAADNEGTDITTGMALAITSTDITINKNKKLKTSATLELQQDLTAVHNLSALDLLQGAAIDEITQEIDGMLVKAVRNAAVAHATVTWGPKAPTGYTQAEWDLTFPRALVRADRVISKASLRRPNVIVVGFDAYERLLNLSGFVLTPGADWDSGSLALAPVGTLNSQFSVFVSRYVPDDEVLLGRKGSGFLDAGVVYSPYVPLFVSERYFDVSKQTTAQSFMSRFGITTVSDILYARVLIGASTDDTGITVA